MTVDDRIGGVWKSVRHSWHAQQKGLKNVKKIVFCVLCGEENFDNRTHGESPRHIRVGANFALRIVRQLGKCPWCEPRPRGKKKTAVFVSWLACADESHKTMLAECEKLQGPLDEVEIQAQKPLGRKPREDNGAT